MVDFDRVAVHLKDAAGTGGCGGIWVNAERLNELGQRVAAEKIVVVEKHDELTARVGQSAVPRY